MAEGGYFITGTDTGIGKTWATLALMIHIGASGRRVAGMKPVATGCQLGPEGWCNEDALLIQSRASIAAPYPWVNPYAFEPPASPHIAAAAGGKRIDLAVIEDCYRRLAAAADWVIVEGVGGWLVPLTDQHSVADMAGRLGLPVILVVGLRLGCINHARLSLAAIRLAGVRCRGWVGSVLDPGFGFQTENIATLKATLEVPLLGILPYMARFDDAIAAAALQLPEFSRA